LGFYHRSVGGMIHLSIHLSINRPQMPGWTDGSFDRSGCLPQHPGSLRSAQRLAGASWWMGVDGTSCSAALWSTMSNHELTKRMGRCIKRAMLSVDRYAAAVVHCSYRVACACIGIAKHCSDPVRIWRHPHAAGRTTAIRWYRCCRRSFIHQVMKSSWSATCSDS
jgi:hypothetical protein